MFLLNISIFLLILKSYNNIFRILINKIFFKMLKNEAENILGCKINDDECPVCYEIIEEKNNCITICNHKFCLQCLLKSYNKNNACPCCRALLIDEKIYNNIDDEQQGEEQEQTEQPELIYDNIPRYNNEYCGLNNEIKECFEMEGYTLLDSIMLLTERYAIEENKNTNEYYYKVLNCFNKIKNEADYKAFIECNERGNI